MDQPLGIRKAQKLATRQKVLKAARELFAEIGYEDATIRVIAERAGVSIGGVFTTFASKAEVLQHVVYDWAEEGLYQELERRIPELEGSTADRLVGVMRVIFSFDSQRPKVMLAHIGLAFDPYPAPGARPFGHNQRLLGHMRQVLLDGITRGEVSPDVDVDLIVDTVAGAYAWNFRMVAHGAGEAEIMGLFARQVEMIARGFAAKAS
ncbi:TetR/AcrR family transcriptional regulator [Caulobacter segnis]|uniref:TetR/AcrR family transcriptional regulator n=1 Tax=Caulobacter segnis TaxID=88688 RepID=UPI00240F47D2|nr:TetR/AcrR family transcriptional regulator [Caulobacter segnis]MDG2519956.1 TetR/AcrR family transcriptional regulator [Caulobacter segnis]